MLNRTVKLVTFALILTISAVIVSAGTAGSAKSVTFDVPFDFQIGNDKFEKGEYRVTRENQNAVLIESLDGTDAKFLLAGNTNERLSSFDHSKLTFYKYGDRYFLRGVNSPSISAYIGESKDEKAVRKEGYRKLAKVQVKAMR